MTALAVLDASAALAYLLYEPGGEKVKQALPHSIMSAINLCEVLNRIGKQGGIERQKKWRRSFKPNCIPWNLSRQAMQSRERPYTLRAVISAFLLAIAFASRSAKN